MTPRVVTLDRDVPGAGLVRALARRARRAARAMGCGPAEIDGIELRIVDDARMRVLKQAHFAIDEPTDVLSFPAAPLLPGEAAIAYASFGEIVLNHEAVRRQASDPGAAGWLDEASSLTIHGVAHLLGHDHAHRSEARRMMACERRGARALGLPCWRPYGG